MDGCKGLGRDLIEEGLQGVMVILGNGLSWSTALGGIKDPDTRLNANTNEQGEDS